MHAIARILAVAYVVLAVFAAGVYVVVTANHTNVAEVQEAYGRVPEQYVRATSVWLNWTGNATDLAIAVVNFTVHNPGKIGVLIVGVNYALHMEDPGDPRNWSDPQKLETTRISRISISYTRDRGLPVSAGETRVVSSTVFVLPGGEQMTRFDRPDPDGKYHPVVWEPWLVYTFVDFDIPYEPVYTWPYHEVAGVVPSG